MTGKHCILQGGEYAAGDPVKAQSAGHGKTDPQRNQGHYHSHGLGVCILSSGGSAHLVADDHGNVGQCGRDDRDKEQADLRPQFLAIGEELPNLERGVCAQVHAKEGIVKLLQLVADTGECIEILGDKLRFGYLNVCRVGAGGGKAQRSENFLNLVISLVANSHHDGEGKTDSLIESDKNGEGNERPDTAAHRIDILFLIELCYFFLILRGICTMLLLKLLHQGLET